VSFAAITLRIASQPMFIVVVHFVMTQFGNFWIHPRTRKVSNTKVAPKMLLHRSEEAPTTGGLRHSTSKKRT